MKTIKEYNIVVIVGLLTCLCLPSFCQTDEVFGPRNRTDTLLPSIPTVCNSVTSSMTVQEKMKPTKDIVLQYKYRMVGEIAYIELKKDYLSTSVKQLLSVWNTKIDNDCSRYKSYSIEQRIETVMNSIIDTAKLIPIPNSIDIKNLPIESKKHFIDCCCILKQIKNMFENVDSYSYLTFLSTSNELFSDYDMSKYKLCFTLNITIKDLENMDKLSNPGVFNNQVIKDILGISEE